MHIFLFSHTYTKLNILETGKRFLVYNADSEDILIWNQILFFQSFYFSHFIQQCSGGKPIRVVPVSPGKIDIPVFIILIFIGNIIISQILIH